MALPTATIVSDQKLLSQRRPMYEPTPLCRIVANTEFPDPITMARGGHPMDRGTLRFSGSHRQPSYLYPKKIVGKSPKKIARQTASRLTA